MTTELRRVTNFGAIDADADELLKDCFTDHPSYLDVEHMRRFLVLGRKGSGKTAIYKELLNSSEWDHLSFGYSFDDYPWHHHDLQAQSGVPEERRYSHSWRYMILIGMAKLLLNTDQSQPHSEESQEALSSLEKFIVDSYGTRDPEMSQLFSPEKEIKLKGTLDLKFLQINGERIGVRELPIHIQAVNSAMQDRIITALNPSISYYVCFDQLDLGFTLTEPNYKHRLVGLLLAAKDLLWQRVSVKRNSIP
ncbi:P-loop ATPase, Sll1717 family [Rhodococcus sp. BP-332]|uniref:P-loop ATPase, Sll1717 family n=1 Tax=Rhodococcus sp. BP-332 TaxID=2739447 RepID=UPI0035AC22F1